ncbi:beta-lactamase family protein [Candidatus Bipolaricaulota bacterium]|nr:beta-lactamase family protein [Candidatus Bipolaricaulota bacterium]
MEETRWIGWVGVLLVLALGFLLGCRPAPRPAIEIDDEGEASETTTIAVEALLRFGETIERLRTSLRIPGLSAAIVSNGELVWAGGFGYANLEDEIAATEATPYGLASVTKPFAAILLMKLVEEGRLDLDTPAAEFGIELENGGVVTVRHLLSHTSEGDPGSRYEYSGNRYAMLTAVIERLYEDSFRHVLRQQILDPLGMFDTALNYGACGIDYHLSTLAANDPERAFEHVYRDLAIPYRYDPDYDVYPVGNPSYANAAAGLISTVDDLARFAVAIGEDSLVSSATRELMFAPTQLNSGEESPYGLGWFVERSHGTELIWHYGYGAYSTLFLMIPSERLAFIALANSQNLSRPFGLGLADVSVLSSPLALEFFKAFIVRPRSDEPLPEIDWTADADSLISQLQAIADPDLLDLYEEELWSYRKLYGGVGESGTTARLLQVHLRAFPDRSRASHDRYQVERPGPRPPEPSYATLTEGETARWVGRCVLNAEDEGTGLPPAVEFFAEEGSFIAVPEGDACQAFYPLSAIRLVSFSNPDMMLVGQGNESPFARVSVEVGGTVVGTYDRVASDEQD